jgi:hypothetical protein
MSHRKSIFWRVIMERGNGCITARDHCSDSDDDDGRDRLTSRLGGWGDRETDCSKFAADLSLGRLEQLRVNHPLSSCGFDHLLVLTVAGAPLQTAHLEEVMSVSLRLQKLDASNCSLAAVPSASAFKRLDELLHLFLHKNQLSVWDDIERAMQPPVLQWFTAFDNPIASQPEFRAFVIRENPSIRAVDYWAVTDAEPVEAAEYWAVTDAEPVEAALAKDFLEDGMIEGNVGLQGCPGSRFATQSQESILSIRPHLLHETRSPFELIVEANDELWRLRHKCNRISAACCIQSFWKGCSTRIAMTRRKARMLQAAITLQRCARSYIWRQRTVLYLQDYLAEINELDLLLNAKEMLRLRAARRIEKSIRLWLAKRKREKIMRNAAEYINRCLRGFIARRRVIRAHLDITVHRKIYFPEEYKWEFLVMLNAVRKMNNVPPLPRTHRFKDADIIGIRIPDTDEVPQRQASIMSITQFSRHCLVRPLRNDRFPDHLWDGPAHRIVDDDAHVPPQIVEAHQKIRRRGVNVNNRCRRLFINSCAPPKAKHPINEVHMEDSNDDDDQVSLVMKSILDGPESDWPYEARIKGKPLNMFMTEAKRIGSRPRRKKDSGTHTGSGSRLDPETGLPCYRKTVWLNQRVLCHDCVNTKIVVDLLLMLLKLSRSTTRMTVVKPVPFLTEKAALQIAAATAIQSTFRAHRVRCSLSCGLRTATVIRRAALCIQRVWRWGLMKRRLELLIGAVKYVRAVKTPILYIEERLLTALNVISSIDRYPPMLPERLLGLGHLDDEANASKLAFVRNDMRGMAKLEGHEMRDATREWGLRRQGGLPRWFVTEVGGLQAVGPDNSMLRRVCGVKGLLLEDIGDRTEDHVETVSLASIKHAAKLAADAPDNKESALVASGGTFRFVELKFHSLAQAKQRALLIYFCTFNSKHHAVVPLLSRSMLHDSGACKKILHLWDIYGLTWPAGDRASPYQLKLRGEKIHSEVVQICGNQPMRHAISGEWKSADESSEPQLSSRRLLTDTGTSEQFSVASKPKNRSDTDRKGGQAEKLAKRDEATFQRYAAFSQQYAHRRQREIASQQKAVQETSLDCLHDRQKAGAHGFGVTGVLPPTYSERTDPAPGAVVRAESNAAKSIIASEKAKEADRLRLIHESVIESRGKGGKAFVLEESILAFHEDCRRAKQQQSSDSDEVRAQEKERRMTLRMKQQEELAAILAFEKAHKAAEVAMLEQVRTVQKVSVEGTKKSGRRRQHSLHEVRQTVQNQEEVEEQRKKREGAKALKAAQRETKKMVRQFLQKRFLIDNACAKHDASWRKDKDIAKAQDKVVEKQEVWARRKAALAECQYVREQFKRNQVDSSRHQLEHMLSLRHKRCEDDEIKKRWQIKAKKAFNALLRNAVHEAEEFEREASRIERGSPEDDIHRSYRQALQAFRDLQDDVESIVQEAEADPESYHPESFWIPERLGTLSDADSDPDDAQDLWDRIPAEWLSKMQSMQARQQLEEHDATAMPEKRTPVLLVPARPAVEPPKILGRLPRGKTMADGLSASGMPGVVFQPSFDASSLGVPAPRAGSLPPLAAERAGRPCLRSEVEAGVEGLILDPTTGSFGEDSVIRTMMSSKAHQASAATLSTDVPHTDSAATLLSSQKSLPPLPLPAAPALPPTAPAVPTHPAFSAFRGNPRPPMIGVGPVMLPPDNYRPPRGFFTAR